ncbi:unnamed protein product [Rhizoctonia solani]|uniref:ABM domain-containing protein n=1 Tax=Rhizoctonia solani TaxID=456999 RepID=A0A8H3H196_9AGAM|nr:unnamed protein product [Rhizoctonia solani]CAE6523022.1 unnamed protein product [Rhizoctonia solani]
MSSTADKFQGRIIFAATLTAKEGQGDRTEAHLKAIQKYALSDKEPGCFTYRVCRSDNEFFVFKEYENMAAHQAHLEADIFKVFAAEVAEGNLIIGVTAQEGQADKVASLLKAIQEYSTSDKEPGCLTYRVCRSENDFFVFEEYANGDAIQEHFNLEGFKNLVNEVGKGTLVVGLTAEDGQADELAKALKSVQEYAVSDKEPGCLTYRVSRSGNQFFVFEEYINAGAIGEHRTTPPYVALGELAKSKTLVAPGSRKVSFYEEF